MTDPAATCAKNAAEAIHDLNYATMPWDGYPGLEFTSDVYRTLGSLAHMAGLLPQALGQLVSWLDKQNASGLIRIDAGHGELADAIDRASFALGTASGIAMNLCDALNSASAATTWMADNDPKDQP